jgi:hypothetical protein
MSLPLVFHPDVQGELDDAFRWYEGQRTGLGDEFLTTVEEVFNRLRRIPEVHSTVYRDVRRAVARRFPYGVFYRIRGDRVK